MAVMTEAKKAEPGSKVPVTRPVGAGLTEWMSPFEGWWASPFEAMNRMFEDMDRGLMPFRPSIGEPKLWAPAVEVVERDRQIIVRADLPGLRKEDITVEVTDDALTIEGERKDEKEEKGDRSYRCERWYGKFYRRLAIPDGVKPEDVEASFANGVLEVVMPAPSKPEAKTRAIPVKG